MGVYNLYDFNAGEATTYNIKGLIKFFKSYMVDMSEEEAARLLSLPNVKFVRIKDKLVDDAVKKWEDFEEENGPIPDFLVDRWIAATSKTSNQTVDLNKVHNCYESFSNFLRNWKEAGSPKRFSINKAHRWLYSKVG